jgi:hypothetical protein
MAAGFQSYIIGYLKQKKHPNETPKITDINKISKYR